MPAGMSSWVLESERFGFVNLIHIVCSLKLAQPEVLCQREVPKRSAKEK